MKKYRGLLIAAVALVMLLPAGVLAACGSGDASASSSKSDVVAAVKGDDQLSQFAEALSQAGVDGKGPYTVFAPTNDALSTAGVTLTGDMVKVSVIEGVQLAKADAAKGTKNDSMLPDNTIVTYTGSNGLLYANAIKVVGDPINAGNGVVYKIDGVIQPK